MFRFTLSLMFLFYSTFFLSNAGESSTVGFNFGNNQEESIASENSRVSWIQKMGTWITTLSKPRAASAAQKPTLPESQMLQEMVDYAMESLRRYLQDEDLDCWTLTDWDQFFLTYRTLDNITARFSEYDGSLRRYFRVLQFEVKNFTKISPDELIVRESKRVKSLNRKLKCGLSL